MSMTALIALAIVAYVLGSISPAYLVGRRRGLDLRKSGSGNLGATNAGEHFGRRVGVAILLLDALKSASATLLGLWVAGDVGGALAGLMSIVGHNWSIFLKFTGGRGMVCSITVLLCLSPILSVLTFGIILAGYLVRRPAPGCALAFVTLPVLAWHFTESSAIRWLCVALAALMFAKRIHANNMRRLIASDAGSVLFWRLLYDRDIADDAAWTGMRAEGNKS